MATDVATSGARSVDRARNEAAEQLQQYLRWASPPNWIAAAGLASVYWWYPVPVVWVLSVLCFLNGCLAICAYRVAKKGNLSAAALLQSTTLWVIAGTLSLTGLELYAVVVMCSVLPVIASLPYVSVRILAGMSVVATMIVAFGGGVILTVAPLSWGAVPETFIYPFPAIGIAVLIGVAGVSLWHTRGTLTDALDHGAIANRELLESERSLEAKVAERTAALTSLQGELTVARDAALAANQQKSEFLSNMSHELRTPLNAVIGFSEVLSAKIFGELTDKQAEYLIDIHSSGQHLLSLINDILDLAKIEAGHLELNASTFDIAAVVDNALTLMRERALQRGVRLTSEIDAKLGVIVADERKVKQVLINLLTNAVKFTESGGVVTLRAARGGSALRIEVEDTGVGIAPEEQALVFEEFRQSSDELSRSQEGTGLGLALSRRLVELHGGTLSVQSAVGAGSTFAFTIPSQPLAEGVER